MVAKETKSNEDIREMQIYKQKAEQIENDLRHHLVSSTSVIPELHSILEGKSIFQFLKIEGNELQHRLLRLRKDISVLSDQLKSACSYTEDNKEVPFGSEEEEADENFVDENEEEAGQNPPLIGALARYFRLSELTKDEEKLYQELIETDKWFNSWKENTVTDRSLKISIAKHNISGINKNLETNLPLEVSEFEEFVITTGGHTGGWEEYDHQLFLKYRNMFQKKAVLTKKIAQHLVGKSCEDVEEHEKWYKEYVEKKKKKQTAILYWKARKELEEKQRSLRKQQKSAKMNVKEEIKKHQLSRTKKLELLTAWKLKKKQKEIAEQKCRENLLIQENKRRANQEKQQEEIRRKVQHYQQYKQKLKEKEKEQKQNENLKFEDIYQRRLNILHFQGKDKQKLKEKQEKLKTEQLKKEKQTLKLEELKKKVSVTSKRDPGRLFQSTASWKHKLTDHSSTNSVLHTHNIQHRAIPQWRKGIYA